ncbi:Type 1 glutamine amidotransferase-like domain-containing protein [Luteimonas sp. TWI1416]|uniref:Type 1 glutamine amidotransferase-like domain-containing protein n=1 Tax=unclassified Luteimonas TaxID=2629088 RepID=UPI003208C511
MRLLLLSLGTGALPDFIADHVGRPASTVRLGYLDDAARPYAGLPFVAAERARIVAQGYRVIALTAGDFEDPAAFGATLEGLDALYVAGGNTFALLAALRRRSVDAALVAQVQAGLPYIGASAGAIVTGPSIEPASLMDDPAEAPALAERRGLGLVDTVVIPHADGALPPYPPALIAEIRRTYGATYPLTFLDDDQALRIDDAAPRLIASP